MKNLTPELRAYIQKIASEYGFDPKFIEAIILQESANDSNAVSSKGAQGLMQVTPQAIADVKRLGYLEQDFNLANSKDNIRAGVAYLAVLRDEYGARSPENLLMMYNGSPTLNEVKPNITSDELARKKFSIMQKKRAEKYDHVQPPTYRNRVIKNLAKLNNTSESNVRNNIASYTYSGNKNSNLGKNPETSSTSLSTSTSQSTTPSTSRSNTYGKDSELVTNTNYVDINEIKRLNDQLQKSLATLNKIQTNNLQQAENQQQNTENAIGQIDPGEIVKQKTDVLDKSTAAIQKQIANLNAKLDELQQGRLAALDPTYNAAQINPVGTPVQRNIFEQTNRATAQAQADLVATYRAADRVEQAPVGSREWFGRIIFGNRYLEGAEYVSDKIENLTSGFTKLKTLNDQGYEIATKGLPTQQELKLRSDLAIASIKAGADTAIERSKAPLEVLEIQTKLQNLRNQSQANILRAQEGQVNVVKAAVDAAQQALNIPLDYQNKLTSIEQGKENLKGTRLRNQINKIVNQATLDNPDLVITATKNKILQDAYEASSGAIKSGITSKVLNTPQIQEALTIAEVNTLTNKANLSRKAIKETNNALIQATIVAQGLDQQGIQDRIKLSAKQIEANKLQLDKDLAQLNKTFKSLMILKPQSAELYN